MPYIVKQHRKELTMREPLRPGELTYELYRLGLHWETDKEVEDYAYEMVTRYLGERYRYDDLAIVLGCLESAFMELNRRKKGVPDAVVGLHFAKLRFYDEIVIPYEDRKIEENGDV
jgi:hypothetical protein